MNEKLITMLRLSAESDKAKALLTLDLLGNKGVGIGDHSTKDFYNNAEEALQMLVDAEDRLGVIEKYFGDGSLLGIRITYLREQRPLGTAGSLALLDPAPTEPVVVSNADLVSMVDFGALLDFHIDQCSDITVAVQDYELQNPFGVVMISDGKVDGIVEKPVTVSKISAGIYVLEPSVVATILRDESCEMPSVLQGAISRELIVTPFQLHEDWIDVGRQSDLKAAQTRFSKL